MLVSPGAGKAPSGARMDGKGDTSPGKLFGPHLSTTLGAGTDPLDAGPLFSHYLGEVGAMGIFLLVGGSGSPGLRRTLQTCPGLPAVPPVPWGGGCQGQCSPGWLKQGGICAADKQLGWSGGSGSCWGAVQLRMGRGRAGEAAKLHRQTGSTGGRGPGRCTLRRGHIHPRMALRSPTSFVLAASEVPGLVWHQPCYFLFVLSKK